MPELTQLGLGLVPLCLFYWSNGRKLLLIAVFATVFGGASTMSLHFGSFQVDIIPPYFPSLVFTALCILRYCAGQNWGGEASVARVLMPFFLFTLYCVVATLATTQIFGGRLLVWPQRPDIFNVRVLLGFSTGNISQLGYLVFTTLFCFLAASYGERCPSLAEKILNVSFYAGYAAVIFGFWQLANALTGLWFPTDLLASNVNGDMNNQMINGSVFRVSGSFTEPAHLAGHVGATVFATFWLILSGDSRLFVLCLFGLSTILVLLSTSTVGYILLATGIPGMMLLAASSRSSGALLRLLKISLCVGIATVAIVAIVSAYWPGVAASAQEVFDGTLNKQDSNSFEERSTWDMDAIGLVMPSFGFGTGWGSTRTSSLVPCILGNCGIWGFLLFVWFIIRIVCLVRRTRRRLGSDPERLRVMDALSASIVASLLSAVLAGPNLNSMEAWLALAGVLGIAVRAQRNEAVSPVIHPRSRAVAPVLPGITPAT